MTWDVKNETEGLAHSAVIYAESPGACKAAVDSFFESSFEVLDICGAPSTPSRIATFKPYVEGISKARDRGARIRLMTDVNEDNLKYMDAIKPFIKEIRHCEGLVVNMALSDTMLIATDDTEEMKPAPTLFYSSSRQLVSLQQKVFDCIWSKSIDLAERLRILQDVYGGKSRHQDAASLRGYAQATFILKRLDEGLSQEQVSAMYFRGDSQLVEMWISHLIHAHTIQLKSRSDKNTYWQLNKVGRAMLRRYLQK